MNGCVYQTADGQCWKFSDKFTNTLSWCVGVNLCKDRKLSNADRIRAMTDEEMAKYLDWYSDTYTRDGKGWLEWLKQEAEE